MRLFIKLKALVDSLAAVWHSRRGELVLSEKIDSNAAQPKPYRRKLGDTTYLVSAVFSEEGTETVIDRISRLLDSRTRYEAPLCLDAKAD